MGSAMLGRLLAAMVAKLFSPPTLYHLTTITSNSNVMSAGGRRLDEAKLHCKVGEQSSLASGIDMKGGGESCM